MRNGKTSISQRVFNAIVAWEALRKGKELSLKEVKYFYYYLSVGENVERNHKTMQRADIDKMYDYDTLTTEHGLKVSKDKPWFEALSDIPRERSSYVRAILRRKEKITKEPRIKLSTIHGSKGGEADNVMLLTDLSRKTDEEYWKNKDSERRVFYVGMTRARNTLTIVRSQSNREFSEAF
jgi:superfamily I DNA/RNA helicase